MDSLLVVGNGGERALLQARHGVTTGNDGSEDVTLHGDTKREGDDIEKEKVGGVGGGGLAGKDTCLNGGTVRNGLVRVDALLELLAVEEVAKELLNLGDTSAATDKHNFVDLALLDGGVLEDLLDWLDGAIESLAVDILESGTGNLGVEVLAVIKRVDFDGGLGTVGKGTLRALASRPQAAQGTRVVADVLLCFSLELLLEMFKEVGVEILCETFRQRLAQSKRIVIFDIVPGHQDGYHQQ